MGPWKVALLHNSNGLQRRQRLDCALSSLSRLRMAELVGAKTVTGRLGLGSWAPKPLRSRALDRKNRSGWLARTPAPGNQGFLRDPVPTGE